MAAREGVVVSLSGWLLLLWRSVWMLFEEDCRLLPPKDLRGEILRPWECAFSKLPFVEPILCRQLMIRSVEGWWVLERLALLLRVATEFERPSIFLEKEVSLLRRRF